MSKGLLKGQFELDAVALPEARAEGVVWLPADPAIALDAVARRLTLASGKMLSWDALLIATGAAPRRWAGPAAPTVHERLLTLHTAAEAHRLRRPAVLTASAERPRRIAVLGGGIVALETAGALRAAGAEVTVVSRTELPMGHHVGPTVGAWIVEQHRRHARLVTGATLARAEPADGGLRLLLTDGQWLDVDLAVLAHGTTPATGWLASSGLLAADGTLTVDARCRVQGAPGIYAAGDAACILGPDGRPGPRGHWTVATDQGRHAARTVLLDLGATTDEPGPFETLPTFTSEAYGTRLTVIGDPGAATTETWLDGDPATDAFTVGALNARGELLGVVGVGPALAALRRKDAVRRRDRLDPPATSP